VGWATRPVHRNTHVWITVRRKLQVDAAIARRKVELLAEFDVAARAV